MEKLERVKPENMSPEQKEMEAKLERLRQEARKEYFEKHGRWPEEDGVEFQINL